MLIEIKAKKMILTSHNFFRNHHTYKLVTRVKELSHMDYKSHLSELINPLFDMF